MSRRRWEHACHHDLTVRCTLRQVGSQQEASAQEARQPKKGKGCKRRAGEDARDEDDEQDVARPPGGEKNELLELSSGLLAVMASAMHSLRPQVNPQISLHSVRLKGCLDIACDDP